jgi:DNA polymerase-1
MPTKFILIDAHSIIFRSYFAFINNPLRNSKGENTSGVFGFLNTLEKIKSRFRSKYMCLIFDAPGETFRDAVYKEYKATRPPPPPDIPFQIEKSKELSQYLGVPCVEKQGYEADDVLATCALRLKKDGEVYIVTSDKDLLQIVQENIFVYDAYQDTVYDRAAVMKKLGTPPERVAEFLALTGDTIDNVPGVPGIGPKRAREILKKYDRFEDALEHDVRLLKHKQKALLSRKLVILECNVPVRITPADLIVKKPDTENLMSLLLDLEFHSYIKSMTVTQHSTFTAQPVQTLSEMNIGAAVGIAREGDSVYVGTADGVVYTIPLTDCTQLLEDTSIPKVGYDIKEYLKEITIVPPFFDVKIAAWLCDPGKKAYTLKDIVLHYLHDYAEITPVANAHYSFQLYAVLTQLLCEAGEDTLYQSIEQPLISVLARMEERGVKIDTAYLKELGVEIEHEIVGLERKIYTLAGREFNINSPKQLAHILFEELKLQPVKRGKKHYSTNGDVLLQLGSVHPLPQRVLTYRELAKIRSTYLDPLVAQARDGRIHTSFNQTGTATGRLSSQNPNIQNIPVRTAVGKRIRQGFVAEHGFSFISADYSQVELRLLAHITRDKNLVDAFKRDKDIHLHTAALMYNVPESSVTDDKRRMAKVVNYGLIYGMSDYGLAKGLDIPVEQATRFIQSYYDLYPGVAAWRDNAVACAEEKGYAETLFGRRRPLPDIRSRNHAIREFTKRAAINTPIQGSAADIIKLAMVDVEKKLQEQGFQRGLLLSIHDELVFEIEHARVEEAQQLIKESMEHIVELSIPLRVTLGVGQNWAEAH